MFNHCQVEKKKNKSLHIASRRRDAHVHALRRGNRLLEVLLVPEVLSEWLGFTFEQQSETARAHYRNGEPFAFVDSRRRKRKRDVGRVAVGCDCSSPFEAKRPRPRKRRRICRDHYGTTSSSLSRKCQYRKKGSAEPRSKGSSIPIRLSRSTKPCRFHLWLLCFPALFSVERQTKEKRL